MYTLHLGDCLDILPTLPPSSVDAIIADPPYGSKKYPTDIEFDPRLLSEWVERYRTVALFGYPELLVRWCVKAAVIPDEWVAWWPTNKFHAKAKLLPRSSEHIAIFGCIPGALRIMRPRVQHPYGVKRAIQRGLDPTLARDGDVWRDSSPGTGCNNHLRLHPNEKPLSLMEKLVLLCSDVGDVILDPFMGSGTTGEACINTGRDFIGIEKEAQYYDIAAKRLETAAARMVQMEIAI